MKTKLKILKQQGEIASERGQQDKALSCLDRALVMALKGKDYAGAINVLGHHLHIYKVLFQETGDKNFMEMFYSDVLAGLRLAEKNNIRGQAKSVMLLRAGDLLYVYERLSQKQPNSMHWRLRELNKTSKQPAGTHAEYIGHWAVALAQIGKLKFALTTFDQAFELLKRDSELRPFHRLIIESGILLRRAEAYGAFKRKNDAEKDLLQAKEVSSRLKRKFGMGARLKQTVELAKQLRIKI